MEPIRFVLVDDSPVFVECASEMLRHLGSVELAGTASSGAEGVALVARTAPELALVDLNMPGMNGIEAIRRIRTGNAIIRIMAVSVNKGSEVRDAALGAGADAFVSKDELAEEFARLVGAWFGAGARSRAVRMTAGGER